MKIVTDAAGLVVMYSDGNPTPPTGGASYLLTSGQEDTFKLMVAVPNGGITFAGGVFTSVPYVPLVLPDMSNVDNAEKAVKAIMLVMAAWNGKTVPQTKAAFKTAWDSLP